MSTPLTITLPKEKDICKPLTISNHKPLPIRKHDHPALAIGIMTEMVSTVYPPGILPGGFCVSKTPFHSEGAERPWESVLSKVPFSKV